LDLERLARHLPLLVGELVVGSCALAAITLTVDEPTYEWFVHVSLVLALALSALNLARHRTQSLPGAVVFIGAFVLYGARHYLGGAGLLMFPGEVAAQQDTLLASLMAWFLVAFACWQANGRNLIFMVVCGLAIFGLMGTVNLNPELFLAFALFICASIFCWGYEQFLELDERVAATAQAHRSTWLQIARGQLSVALLVGLLTLGLGGVIGAGVYRVTPNLYATMSQRAYGWDVGARVQRLFSSFDSSFRIGGGPVRLSDVPVMQVAADRAALWRGAVYDYYDGARWRRTPVRWTDLLSAPDGGLQAPPELLPVSASKALNRQRFRTLGPSSLLFAAAQPVWLDFPGRATVSRQGWPVRRPRPVLDTFGCLTWSVGEAGGAQEYTVVSQEPCTEADLLRQCPADYPLAGFERYLQVPSSTVLLLEPLARRLTADAATPYDKVAALQKYIERTCLYSLNARAVPARADAVDYFLNHSQRGACDLFSSSLTVLCRIAGLPARVATGYASGKYDAVGGYFDVRGTDAHAWT
ncbi:MAG: transglutaminase-like domain-containing protein, partial [Armatimonadota bacterium]